MSAIRFPRPLRPGQTVAVTAPSSGVPGRFHRRLDHVLAHLVQLGFRVVEGQCLRGQFMNQSASAADRTEELMRFLLDERVDAIFPPWGGDRAIELLPLIDWPALNRVRPKWLLGYSDISTLGVPLLLKAGWANAHCTNLMDFAPAQQDCLTRSVFRVLGSEVGEATQRSSEAYQERWADFSLNTEAAFCLTRSTAWKRLGNAGPVVVRGRLIGGCIDTLSRLAGSAFADLLGFVRRMHADGVLLYLENSSYAPPELLRALYGLRFNGWFDELTGVVIGRSSHRIESASEDDLAYEHVLVAALGHLPCPVLYDADIGHVPPQLTLINGAMAEIAFDGLGANVFQRWQAAGAAIDGCVEPVENAVS